ncbi:MAG: 50S ribosomal protein L13 [bacterium]|nr:50S ribosomal protein L13 [bacterium]
MKTIHIDASGKVLGRLAVEIALILRGKDVPDFAPNKESGNIIVIENVDKILMTGAKLSQKQYFSHSGYPKGAKMKPVRDVFKKDPGEVLRRAVLGMLPHNKLSSKFIKNLKFQNT